MRFELTSRGPLHKSTSAVTTHFRHELAIVAVTKNQRLTSISLSGSVVMNGT